MNPVEFSVTNRDVASEAREGGRYTVTHALHPSIAEVFERGMGAFGVRRSDDGGSVLLYDRVLVEDDGPGAGSDAEWLVENRSPVEELSGDIRIKKILRVERPQALEVRLYEADGVLVEVNGHPLGEGPTAEPAPRIPPALLKKGDNEFIVYAPSGQTRSIKIADARDILKNAPDRADRPRRSFRSADGGRTWQPIEGEYILRLHVVQYIEEGFLLSPVLDLGRTPDDPAPILSRVAVESVTLKADAVLPAGTALDLLVRTGATPAPDECHWSGWRAADAPAAPEHRYLQWKATLRSDSPTVSPRLRGVEVRAGVRIQPAPVWAAKVSVRAAHNEEIRYTSIPFRYEDPRHPRMVALREKYRLDDVVAGAGSELEKFVKLRDWVAKQWRFEAPARYYPAWDADDILTARTGFCVQFAIVFMQCATALGYQTRFLFGDNSAVGHEVTEVWSNEFGKWIYMDNSGNFHHVDPRTGVPMNLLEVRDLILKTYYPGNVADRTNRPAQRVTSPEIATCYGPQVTPVGPKNETMDAGGKDGGFYVPLKWMQLRYMDRNDFLAQPLPVPKTQGATWDYSDYWLWDDGRQEPVWRYRHITARRSDLRWTINQVHYAIEWSERPNTLCVRMVTQTPHLETFLVNGNGGGWAPSGNSFEWTLRPGANRLEMRVLNTSGVEGIVSFIELDLVS